MECFYHAIVRILYKTVHIPRKVVSAEPNITFYSTETSIYDSNIFINLHLKSQVAWCTHMRDMKKSVICVTFYRLELKLCFRVAWRCNDMAAHQQHIVSSKNHQTRAGTMLPWPPLSTSALKFANSSRRHVTSSELRKITTLLRLFRTWRLVLAKIFLMTLFVAISFRYPFPHVKLILVSNSFHLKQRRLLLTGSFSCLTLSIHSINIQSG